MSLYRNDSIQKIRTFFFLKRVYVKKGKEKDFLNSLLGKHQMIGARTVLQMKDRGAFEEHPMLDDTPMVFYSQEDVESEYLKVLIEEKFGRCRQTFWNQEKIARLFSYANSGEITSKQLRFLKKQRGDSFNYYYLCNDAVEQQKYCLRAYHPLISESRKRQLQRIVNQSYPGV